VIALAALVALAASGHPAFVSLAEVAGSIDPGSGGYLLEAIHEAETSGAEALIVRLDTPGGLLSTTRDVVQAELSSRVPIVFWVGPPGARAGSAGVFLTLAANVAAMAPSTNIGAAHPVGIGGGSPRREKDDRDQGGQENGGKAKGGKGKAGKHKDKGTRANGDAEDPADDASVMARKVENDTAAFVEGIAERRSRNVEWAQQAVRESVSITASKALELKVIDLLAEDVPELLGKIDGRTVPLAGGESRTLHTAGAEIRPAQWSVRHRVLHFLADPEIALLIFVLGALGILAELYTPGTVIPGVVGAMCILIAATAFQMLPINAGALALIVLGLGLFAAELYVGGHGGFIVAGAVCVVIGSLLLVGRVGSGWFADRDYGIGWRVVAPVGISLLLIGLTLAAKVNRSSRNRLSTGASGMVGQVGEVRDAITAGAAGRVLVNGELWSARSKEPLPLGARARVLKVEGLMLEVTADGAA
jgi:membrane-bound serine protease (ClpP class)